MNTKDTIITVYCLVAKIIDKERLRKRGSPPSLSDSEVLTMEIIGEMEGKHTDAAIWHYFTNHWRGWFPALDSFLTLPSIAPICTG